MSVSVRRTLHRLAHAGALRIALSLPVVLVASMAVGDVPALAETGKPLTLQTPPASERVATAVAKASAKGTDPTVAAAARTAGLPAPVWPKASDVEAALPSAGARAAGQGGPVRLAGTAVSVDAAATDSVSKVRVETFDRATAVAAGVSGLLLRITRTDGGLVTGGARIGVDYSAFRTAYGADWPGRLRLVRLPACALTTPAVAGCLTETPLASTNDPRTSTVSATVPVGGQATSPSGDAAAGDVGTVVALAAGAKSGAGSYAATSLQPSFTWSAGSSSGDFTWSYPIKVPPSLGGPAPSIGLSYSAQSVDGMMAASNNQPSWLGQGFDWQAGYIERRYRGCSDDMDGTGHNNTTKTGDECWETDNATMSMDGHAGDLIKDGTDSSRWHLRNDDASLISHRTGGSNGDNDGEFWVVTTTNGTQYWFGESSVSTSVAPVYGNDPNEPCHQSTFAASSCVQAYRWNLDKVVDPHGNTMTYVYGEETNQYGANMSSTSLVGYDRAAYLKEIDYGTRTGSTGSAPMRVVVDTADRCLSGCATHDAVHWPDTPWDQECTKAPCDDHSPTFWSTRRLSKITTQVWNPAKSPAGYDNVDSWTLTHSFPDPGDGTRAGLWLSKISHAGLVGGTTTVPDITFDGIQLNNRVDTLADALFPMNWWRIANVYSETGEQLGVTYAPADCVKGSRMPDPAHLENNTLRCYPVKWTPDGYPAAITDYFHKYVVAKVTQDDLTGGAPPVVTSYSYLGTPAWHYTDDDGLVKASDKTWSVWRGYGTVQTRVGDPADATVSLAETQYYRGMNGDHLPSGTRGVSLPAADLNGDGDTSDPADVPAQPDEDAYDGMVRASITFNGPGGTEVSRTVNEAWQSAPTASRTIHGSTVSARFTNTTAEHNRQSLDSDGGTRGAGWRTTSSTNTFDPYGLPSKVDDHGDDAVTGDESCTLTDYARNTTAWLVALQSRVRTFAVGCAAALAGGLSDAQVIGDGKTLYDGLAFGAAPTKGDVTETDSLKAYNAGSPTYLTTSRAAYDPYGRVVDGWDVLGNHTGTTYTPASGPVTQQKTTNPLGWDTTTTLQPAWGAPLSTVDTNGRRTDIDYDPLGRTTAVWEPGQDKASGQAATQTFSYLIQTAGPNMETTSSLIPSGGYLTTTALYDGLLRARQTQAPATGSGGGRVITDTLYDSAGRAFQTRGPYTTTGNPGGDLVIPTVPQNLPTWTTQTFDGAGRVTASVLLVRNVEKWRTSYAYTGDRTDVTPPLGGSGTSTVTDGDGHTVALRQYHSQTPTGAYDTTRYTYDAKGQLSRVTDPAGNHWDYAYDVRGRQIEVDDPDAGRTTKTYDDAGRLMSTTNSLNQTVAYTYDVLNRTTSLRDGTATGAKRAEWVFDTLSDGTQVRGQLARSIRYVGSDAYVNEVLGYNTQYQPTSTKVTLPDSETGFGASSFTYVNTYNADGSPASSRIPAAGDLTTENLTYGYNTLGMPNTLGTSIGATLVTASTYTDFGEPQILTLQNNAGKLAQVGRYYEDGTHRLNEIKTTSAVTPTITYADQHYSYNPVGTLKTVSDTAASDTQCYGYDELQRLNQAWTPASGDCAATPTVAALGGPAPYWQQWTFDALGDRKTEIDHGPTDTTWTSTYPAAGSAQPHAVTKVVAAGAVNKTNTYGYDPTGNTTSRAGAASGQTLSWDAEGRLSKLVDSTGSTSYVYDADGSRLIRKDPTGKTLYLSGQEVRFTTSTGAATCTRYYDMAGMTVGTRTAAGLTWMSSDDQGTTDVTVAASTQTVAIRRTTPYGSVRGTAGTWPSTMDKGLVGGTVDDTGLTHLGAREYDPALGRFISDDPVFDAQDPQSLQGYAYGDNDPVNRPDPAGTDPCGGACHGAGQLEPDYQGYGNTVCHHNCYSPPPKNDPHPQQKPKHKKCGTFDFKCKVKKAAAAVGNFYEEHKTIIATVVGVAVSIGVGALCEAVTAGAGSLGCAMLAGAAGNLVSSAMQGQIHSFGDAFKSMAAGAVEGLVGFGIGKAIGAVAGVAVKAGKGAAKAARGAADEATAGGKAVRGAAKTGHGSGPAPGVLEVGPGVKSTKAFQNYSPGGRGGIEYVFEPSSNRLLVGAPKKYLKIPGSPHQQLANAGGLDGGRVLGGMFRRDANGGMNFDESSGHYGDRWTDATRRQFTDFLDSFGFNATQEPW